jgi:hypothetical protein
VEQQLGIQAQLIANRLQGATDLREALAALIRSARDDEILAKALKKHVDTVRSSLTRWKPGQGR